MILSLVFSGFFFLKNYKFQGLLLLTVMGSVALIISMIKTLVHVYRPTNGLMFSTGYSYPSGHSAGCIVLGGLLAYFAWQHWQSKRSRALIGVSMSLLAAMVGLDRLYLNVHWVSDVIGGWLFGAFCFSFTILVLRRLKTAGIFVSERFNFFANLLYFGAIVFVVIVVILGLFYNFLTF